MADEDREESAAGRTALLATVPEVEPVVDRWRRRFDAGASVGVPAHVTVLFPFLGIERVTSAVIDELTVLIGRHSPIEVRFDRCRRFPDALYLAPTPDQPFRTLTGTIAERWPEAPPYEGRFADVVPHLTVAHGQPPRVFDEVETALAGRLPVAATISSITLFVSDGERWQPHSVFPLLG